MKRIGDFFINLFGSHKVDELKSELGKCWMKLADNNKFKQISEELEQKAKETAEKHLAEMAARDREIARLSEASASVPGLEAESKAQRRTIAQLSHSMAIHKAEYRSLEAKFDRLDRLYRDYLATQESLNKAKAETLKHEAKLAEIALDAVSLSSSDAAAPASLPTLPAQIVANPREAEDPAQQSTS